MKEEEKKTQTEQPEQKWEEMLQKARELLLSKMGILLLAGVLVFILSGMLSGQKQTDSDLGENSSLGKSSAALEGGEMSENGAGTSSYQSGTAGQEGWAEEETLRYLMQQEERLKSILEQMEGIGKVEVMLSVSSSRERVVLSENPYSQRQVEETDSAGGTRQTKEVERKDTTVYESSSGTQIPYVIKELEPELSGVLVVAEGAGSDAVKAEIVEAVEALFGLPAHRIKVIKRRG